MLAYGQLSFVSYPSHWAGQMPRASNSDGHDILYAELLRGCGHGEANFQADPFGQYPSVKLCDAGYKIPVGKFIPRCNLWPSNVADRPSFRTEVVDIPKPLIGGSIKEVFTDPASGSNTSSIADDGQRMFYRIDGDNGALLSLKDHKALSYDLDPISEQKLRDILIENCSQIAEDCGINLAREELLVITGTTLTGDWDACVALKESSTGASGSGDRFFPVTLTKTPVSIQCSENHSIHTSSGHHHHHLFQKPTGAKETSNNCCQDVKNQCIFIRALRVRQRRINRRQPTRSTKLADSNIDVDMRHAQASLQQQSSSDEDSDQDLDGPPRSASDRIFARIFQALPHVEYVMLHDRDITLGHSTPAHEGTMDPPHITFNVDNRSNFAFPASDWQTASAQYEETTVVLDPVQTSPPNPHPGMQSYQYGGSYPEYNQVPWPGTAGYFGTEPPPAPFQDPGMNPNYLADYRNPPWPISHGLEAHSIAPQQQLEPPRNPYFDSIPGFGPPQQEYQPTVAPNVVAAPRQYPERSTPEAGPSSRTPETHRFRAYPDPATLSGLSAERLKQKAIKDKSAEKKKAALAEIKLALKRHGVHKNGEANQLNAIVDLYRSLEAEEKHLQETLRVQQIMEQQGRPSRDWESHV